MLAISQLDKCFGLTTWQNGSATTPESREDPAWNQCIDALLHELHHAPVMVDEDDDSPSYDAIRKALTWLVAFKSIEPSQAPTRITREPAGGVMIERRVVLDHRDVFWVVTFGNDGSQSLTICIDGKVQYSSRTGPDAT